MTSQFSVLMSVYRNDNPDYFLMALRSVWDRQTLRPSEVLLVVDGPVGAELNESIAAAEREIPVLIVHRLPENVGLGRALAAGLLQTSYDIVARMDSDDIALPDRFQSQMNHMRDNPGIAVVGGQISEFIDSENKIIGKRIVPRSGVAIDRYLKSRCPFNHMTVMFHKPKVIEVGNYQHWHFNEDYYLWIRMAQAGMKFANLEQTLVNVRVGDEMYRRRGGWRYFKSEAALQGYMLRHGVIGFPRYLYNVAGRFAVQVAMPNSLRGFIFKKLFRK